MKEALPLKTMYISQILLIRQKIHFENLFLYHYKGFSYLLYSCCNPCKSMYSIIHYANLQLSSCIIHVCTSIGKFLRSIGQESIKVNLKEHKKPIKNIAPPKDTELCRKNAWIQWKQFEIEYMFQQKPHRKDLYQLNTPNSALYDNMEKFYRVSEK